jgi:hypothetical protein
MFHNKDYNNQNGIIVDSLTCKYINNIDFTSFYNNTISGSFGNGSGSTNSDITCNNLNCNIDATIAGQLNTYALIINYGQAIIDNYGNITTEGNINLSNKISLNGFNGDITCGLINGHHIQTIAQMVYDNFYINLSTPKISTLEIVSSNSILESSSINNLTISNLIYSPNGTINNLSVDNFIVNYSTNLNNGGLNVNGDSNFYGDLNVNNIVTNNIFNNLIYSKIVGVTNDLGNLTTVLDGNDSSITTNTINFKNTTGTSLLKIDSGGVTIINSVNSFQFFKRQMATNTATYTSSTKYFSSGIKCINLSFSHYCTTAGNFTLTLLLKNGATTLQTITQNYALTTLAHLSQSFHFLTSNITSQNMAMTITITNGTGVFASDANDYITCLMFNLCNTVN